MVCIVGVLSPTSSLLKRILKGFSVFEDLHVILELTRKDYWAVLVAMCPAAACIACKYAS